MQPSRPGQQRRIISIEAAVALIVALVNLALDQADIHILLISWVSIAACVALAIDILRRAEWTQHPQRGNARLLIGSGVVVIAFVAFGLFLTLHKKGNAEGGAAQSVPPRAEPSVERATPSVAPSDPTSVPSNAARAKSEPVPRSGRPDDHRGKDTTSSVVGVCGAIPPNANREPPVAGSQSTSVLVTRSSAASGANVREFVTTGGGIYEVDMKVPSWRPEELDFKFEGTSIRAQRSRPFPQTLNDSGHPLTIDKFTDIGFEINDSGCSGIPYTVTWIRGSELTNHQGGTGVGAVTQGPCGVIQIGGAGNTATGGNCSPPQRTIKEEDRQTLIDTLTAIKAKVYIVAAPWNPDAVPFGQDLAEMFIAAKWEIQGMKVNLVAFQDNMPPGVRIGAHVESQKLEGGKVSFRDDSLLGQVVLALTKAHVKGVYVNTDASVADGVIEVLVSANPDATQPSPNKIP
jgi:hypothetical protein